MEAIDIKEIVTNWDDRRFRMVVKIVKLQKKLNKKILWWW